MSEFCSKQYLVPDWHKLRTKCRRKSSKRILVCRRSGIVCSGSTNLANGRSNVECDNQITALDESQRP